MGQQLGLPQHGDSSWGDAGGTQWEDPALLQESILFQCKDFIDTGKYEP